MANGEIILWLSLQFISRHLSTLFHWFGDKFSTLDNYCSSRVMKTMFPNVMAQMEQDDVEDKRGSGGVVVIETAEHINGGSGGLPK